MRLRLVLLAAAVVAVLAVADLAGAFRGGAAGGTGSPLLGRPAPTLAGSTVAGGHYRLKPGAVTVVAIWASWCAPCRDEVPLISRFAAAWAHRGVRVVTVDTRDGILPARHFLAAVGARQLLAVHDPQGRIAVSWGATGVPETFVVDGSGVVRAHRIGEADDRWLTDAVRRWAGRGASCPTPPCWSRSPR
jgi:cytochrome c biogenesis protein CcmG/thiol:disulfide interchange protein DsbE